MHQLIEEILWEIIENFYTSFCLFRAEYQRYERQIQHLCASKQVSRDQLLKRLSPEEAESLFNYQPYQKILDHHLEPLQKLCWQLVRESEHGELLEHGVRDIFYEISLLTTECYKVKVSSDKYAPNSQAPEPADNFPVFFPWKMLILLRLFNKTKEELEKLVAKYRDSKILLRSLFLFGEEVVGASYEGGFDEFLQKVYVECQVLEFYAKAAFSFSASGFDDYAIASAKKFAQFSEHHPQHPCRQEWRLKLDAIWQQAAKANSS